LETQTDSKTNFSQINQILLEINFNKMHLQTDFSHNKPFHQIDLKKILQIDSALSETKANQIQTPLLGEIEINEDLTLLLHQIRTLFQGMEDLLIQVKAQLRDSDETETHQMMLLDYFLMEFLTRRKTIEDN